MRKSERRNIEEEEKKGGYQKEWPLRGQSVCLTHVCCTSPRKGQPPNKENPKNKAIRHGMTALEIWVWWVGVGKGFCMFVCACGQSGVCVLVLVFECGPERTQSSHVASILGSPPCLSFPISSATTYHPLVRSWPDCPSDANQPHIVVIWLTNLRNKTCYNMSPWGLHYFSEL